MVDHCYVRLRIEGTAVFLFNECPAVCESVIVVTVPRRTSSGWRDVSHVLEPGESVQVAWMAASQSSLDVTAMRPVVEFCDAPKPPRGTRPIEVASE